MLLRAPSPSVTTTYPGFVGDGAASASLTRTPSCARCSSTTRARARVAHAVRALLAAAAQAVRDQLSGDIWLVLGRLERELAALADGPGDHVGAVTPTLGRGACTGLLALAGLVGESMVRDPGWPSWTPAGGWSGRCS